MSYASYDNKTFSFGDIKIVVDYIKTLAPSDAVAFVSSGYDVTGLKLWPATKALCRYILENQEKFQKRKILELGSGAGLSGLLVSHFCETVLLTDGNDECLELLGRNINANIDKTKDSNVGCQKLEWGKDIDFYKTKFPELFDVILGADIIYSAESIPLLLKTVKELLKPSGFFLLVYVSRSTDLDKVLERHLEQSFDLKDESQNGVNIRILYLTHK
eukprot:TRINITY_DN9043_c0_g1_i2.p1 TRINITY_DN9043_c0_g1~~TRINITY_DN9043_c0_g1_i2.p1  ORF type:complete len:250 (+),score=36.90 TRINITY_DN9043_c0_g1_i2:100-750(+)